MDSPSWDKKIIIVHIGHFCSEQPRRETAFEARFTLLVEFNNLDMHDELTAIPMNPVFNPD